MDLTPLAHDIMAVLDIRDGWLPGSRPENVKQVEGLQVLFVRGDDLMVAGPKSGKLVAASTLSRLVGFTNDGETLGDYLHPKRAERAHRVSRFVGIVDKAAEVVR
jgi:hypothetical protein